MTEIREFLASWDFDPITFCGTALIIPLLYFLARILLGYLKEFFKKILSQDFHNYLKLLDRFVFISHIEKEYSNGPENHIGHPATPEGCDFSRLCKGLSHNEKHIIEY